MRKGSLEIHRKRDWRSDLRQLRGGLVERMKLNSGEDGNPEVVKVFQGEKERIDRVLGDGGGLKARIESKLVEAVRIISPIWH